MKRQAMIHNIASCDAVIAPRTEINTCSTENLPHGLCALLWCMWHVWRNRQKDIRELCPGTTKVNTTVMQVMLPPFGNRSKFQFIFSRIKLIN